MRCNLFIQKVVFFTVLLSGLSVFSIVESDGYPWNGKLEIDNIYEAEFRKKYPDGGFYINLGPTGIRAQIMTDKPNQFLVRYVFQDDLSPARGKIEIGDIITGANGKAFSSHIFGRRGNRVGRYGPVMDLSNAIEESQGKDGVLDLSVLKKGTSKSSVKLQLEVKGKFAKTFPYGCERSEKMAKVLCDQIAEYYKKHGNFGRVHVHTHCTLALMANGYNEHESLVKKIMADYKNRKYDPFAGGFVTWGWGFDGILMGEYSNLYNDKSFKSSMESLAAVYPEGSKGTGHFTHRSFRNLDQNGGTPYASIAGISGLAMLSMTLIKRAGYEYPDEFYNVIHQKYLNNATPSSLMIAYSFGNSAPDKNRNGIEPRHAIIKLKDPKKGLSGKGAGYECPTGMKNIGEYEIIWPTKEDPRWKPTDWIAKEAATNKVFEMSGANNMGLKNVNDLRRVERNHPDYKEPANPEPKSSYRTTEGVMHPLPVGLGALAHLLDPEKKKSWEYLGRHAANTSALSFEHAFDGHGGGNLHAFWTTLGAGFADENHKREYLDYMKCFFIMDQTHYGHMIIQPLSRDRPGGNGDPFYGPVMLPTSTAAILLSLAKKRLLITGASDGKPPVTYTAKKATVKDDTKLAVTIRRPIKLDEKQTEKADRILLGTLIKLSQKNEIKTLPLKVSFSSEPIIVQKIDDYQITFIKATDKEKSATIDYTKLKSIDRANLSLLVAESKPDSMIANALASLYMENFGNQEYANKYLKKTSDEYLDKIEANIKNN